MMDIKDLKEHLDTASTEMKALVQRQSDEIKAYGEASKEASAAIAKADARLAEMTAELEAKEARLTEVEKKTARPNFGGDFDRKTLGQMYVESEAYKHAKSIGRGNNEPVEVQRKDITSAAGSAGALTDQYRNPEIYKNPDRMMFIRQLVNRTPVTDSAVEIMRENVFTNAAAPQYNVSGTPVNQLVAKEKSDITFSLETVPVRTIAHYIVASRQVLADAARLRNYIDGRLTYGLNLEFDSQILYGDGLTENFKGLFTDVGVSNVGEIANGTSADDLPGAMIDHIRAAITRCQLNEYYNVNGLIMNPVDWQTIETAKGSDGHYIWVTVPNGGESRLWRVPVIVTNAVTSGDFLLGDWTMGATLYERESMAVRVADQHAELFVKNGIVVLAEERAAFAVELPKAFCKGSFEVAAS
jgi:HK97 family phage major capsid protein